MSDKNAGASLVEGSSGNQGIAGANCKLTTRPSSSPSPLVLNPENREPKPDEIMDVLLEANRGQQAPPQRTLLDIHTYVPPMQCLEHGGNSQPLARGWKRQPKVKDARVP